MTCPAHLRLIRSAPKNASRLTQHSGSIGCANCLLTYGKTTVITVGHVGTDAALASSTGASLRAAAGIARVPERLRRESVPTIRSYHHRKKRPQKSHPFTLRYLAL